jgi:Ethanolamine utilization protein EutJ (predicted chaperonin)
MSRNLLPRFRSTPNPANVEPLPPGRWTQLQNPVELAKLELPAENESEIRTRIQSIPSPWARLHLFRNALEDPSHPARRLVENEILDALELVWSLGSARGTPVEVSRVRLDALRGLAQDTGSRRVEDFAGALVELAPRQPNGSGLAAVPTLSLLLVGGSPVFASSPYTLLFTAEDAAREETRGLFRYASGAEHRPLARRPFAFQRYVAQVLIPQLSGQPQEVADEYVEWATLQRCVTQWLTRELRECSVGKSERVRDQLTPPAAPGGWRTAAEALHLEPLSHQAFGGVVLFRRRPGAELDESRWRLRAEGAARPLPIVIDPESFDGRFFEGAPLVQLPPDLQRLERGVLPGVELHHPWVNPYTDWLTDQIFLLSNPLRTDSVKGLKGYRVQAQNADARFSQPRLALPLKGEFFLFFTPDEVDRMLAVEVLSNGSVAVQLTVPLGTAQDPGQVVVRRVYPETHVLKQYGPELVLWPAFAHPEWRDYTVFRSDRESFVSEHVELRAYAGREPLNPSGTARRTPTVGAVAFDGAPEILEFRNTTTGTGERAESLGVVLPRLAPAAEPNEGRWSVGVDFGTSNTLVCIRPNDEPAASIFQAAEMVLPLTQAGADTAEFLEGYFFPPAVQPAAFGTAVVHLAGLPHLDLSREQVGVRVSVPFSGIVQNEGQNRVTGDLKWSPHRETYFLSAAFLRHVVATVLAEALRRGVRSKNVSITFSYPRAFDGGQVSNLEDQWREVKNTFAAHGLGDIRIEPGVDESQSVLRHFFNAAQAGTLGAGDVILDVGGGTTDLAAYGESKTLLLDSMLLGGKNLTGPRTQASSNEGITNPFVEAFVRWAEVNDLPDGARSVVRKYMSDKQVHLAFSYLVRTRWFADGKASLFRATPEFRSFQAMVFYFFAAIFHYVGLSFRALPPVAGTRGPRVPEAVTLAGNGSQYLHWLTDLRPGQEGDAFRKALSDVLRRAAGAPARGPVVKIVVSETPKQEVARGLVALVANQNLNVDPLADGPVVGERVTAQLREGRARVLEPTTRMGVAEKFTAERLRSVRWAEGKTELETFHESLLAAAESLIAQGGGWVELSDRYSRIFSGYGAAGLREAVLKKLEYQVNLAGGYRGSLFTLGATAVLERMLNQLFEVRP